MKLEVPWGDRGLLWLPTIVSSSQQTTIRCTSTACMVSLKVPEEEWNLDALLRVFEEELKARERMMLNQTHQTPTPTVPGIRAHQLLLH